MDTVVKTVDFVRHLVALLEEKKMKTVKLFSTLVGGD